MIRSSNPVLNDRTFQSDFGAYGASPAVVDRDDVMTINGTIFKTLAMVAILVATATFTWGQFMSTGSVGPWLMGGLIGGLVLALATVFKPTWAPITAPLYAAAQGLFLGGISAMYTVNFAGGTAGGFSLTGIVPQAIGLTIATLAAMLILYAFRIIKVTEKLRAGIFMAVGAAMLFYLVVMVIGLFGVDTSFMVSGSPLALGISGLMIAIASASLLLDFDFIERGARSGAPKHMEWVGGFGLLVTLIWLYLEFLRLLAMLQGRE